MKCSFIRLVLLANMMSLTSFAQTDNPRGVYKLTHLIDKTGTYISAPMDQYKVCTDSMTLTVMVTGSGFSVSRTPSELFNYTGEAPDAHDAKASRVFESDASHFTLKWWSTLPNHMLFPHDGWVTEYYESGQYSDMARTVFDALMVPAPAVDAKHPLYGNWHIVGLYDEMPDVKADLKKKKVQQDFAYKGTDIAVVTPTRFVYMGGQVCDIQTDGKTFFRIVPKHGQPNEHKVKVLSRDYTVVVKKRAQFTDYELWKRITDDVPPINRMAARFSGRRM